MTPTPHPEVLLSARDLAKHYGTARRPLVRALDGVSIDIQVGRAVGIAGESGSGKSTLLRLLLDLEPPTSGVIEFGGQGLDQLNREDKRRYRASVQAVFQDPGSSLDPHHRIWRSVTEPAWAADGLDRAARRALAEDLLSQVGLAPHHLDSFPHQLSGGERQRVAIARALSSRPKVVLLDEPVTSLDVSVRAQMLNLLSDRASALGVTYVVISHDLTAIYYLTDYLYIVYRGIVVEEGPTVEVIDHPRHPYTRLLVASVGDPLYDAGTGAEDTEAPEGACPYLPRCPVAIAECETCPPSFAPPGAHPTRCWLAAAGPDQSVTITRPQRSMT